MIDFHSHILPGIDDGSSSVQESLSMIEIMKEQGTEIICATPHFYASRSTPERFFEKRKKAYEALIEAAPAETPAIFTGAEVRFFPGVSRIDGLDKFCLGNTGLLLLEMPFDRWTDHNINEVRELADYSGMTVMLAHYERYQEFTDIGSMEMLKEHGVLIQTNAENILGFFSGMKAMKLIKSGFIDVLGSDAHNLSSRRPNLGEAYSKIGKKLGSDFLAAFSNYGSELI